MKQIITSLLENDLYKLTMQQLVLGKYSDVEVEYKFYNRGDTPFPKGFAEKLREQVEMLASLKLTDNEFEFLQSATPFLKTSYLEWLKGFSPNPNHVQVIQKGTSLRIKIKGPWYKTIYWEVPLMATISELFFLETNRGYNLDYTNYVKKANRKGLNILANNLTVADFGLRRRYSREVQDNVIRVTPGLIGTSNVKLAQKYNIRPIGTMAHELPMVFAAIHGFQSANEKVLSDWQDEFDGDLGIALTDTFTTDVFLRSFSKRYANAFDGVRQDSGNPEKFTDKMVQHYENLQIDPMTKTIVFSDGLNVNRAIQIAQYCEGKIKCSFGIGTNLTNDVGVLPLNIVIKASKAGKVGRPMLPTVKLSDTPGKVTGDKEMVQIAKTLLGV